MKKAALPLPRLEDHPSYRLHRRQRWIQIFLPVLLTALLALGMTLFLSLATFEGDGGVSRWAAIATVWLTLPVMVAGLALLALLVSMNYLLARLRQLIPPYSHQAQQFFYRLRGRTRRLSEWVHRPVLVFRELATSLRHRMRKVKERM